MSRRQHRTYIFQRSMVQEPQFRGHISKATPIVFPSVPAILSLKLLMMTNSSNLLFVGNLSRELQEFDVRAFVFNSTLTHW